MVEEIEVKKFEIHFDEIRKLCGLPNDWELEDFERNGYKFYFTFRDYTCYCDECEECKKKEKKDEKEK